MTAYVIPNAIQVITRRGKYTFASLLSRDTTYDVLYNIWRSVRPEGFIQDSVDQTTSMGSVVEGMLSPPIDGSFSNGVVRQATTCSCGKEGQHYSEVALETVIPGEPEKIYNLMFASGFIKDFMRDEEKLTGKWFRMTFPCEI